ncbi:Berberine/berberine-like [Dillenia turbinata]|uniref:Berberine/berberine-like n=1 Tax=Dillenia turbinata TaxID=194707 RepID=A0AAN8VUQ4_9MAGN
MTPFVSSNPRAAYINCMDLDLEVMNLVSPGDSSDADGVDLARTRGAKYFLKNFDRLVRAKTSIMFSRINKNCCSRQLRNWMHDQNLVATLMLISVPNGKSSPFEIGHSPTCT